MTFTERARPMRAKLPATLCVLALLAGCSGDGETRGEFAVREDGLVEADLSQAPSLEEEFGTPRRYPFTVAVAPLYIEWTEQGREQVHGEVLPSPIPYADVGAHPVAAGWPGTPDSAEEEREIQRVLRERFALALAEAAESGALPTGEAPDDAGEAPDDAGEAPDDAGEAPDDAGEAPDDAGEAPDDAGEAPDDAGEAPDDAGEAPDDAGEAPDDAGEAPAEDAGGAPAEDAGGAPAEDAGEESAEDADAAPADAPKEPAEDPGSRYRRVSQLGRDLLASGLACPPEGDEGWEASQPALVGSFAYSLPVAAEWEDFDPGDEAPGALLGGHRTDARGGVRVWAAALDPAELVAPDAPLVTDEEALARIREQLAQQRDVVEIASVAWGAVGEHPTADARVVLRAGLGPDEEAPEGADGPEADGAYEAYLYYVFTAEQVFVLSVTSRPQVFRELVQPIRASVEVDAPPIAVAPREAQLPEQDLARGREIDAFDGKNFAIDPAGFRDRTAGVLEQFGLFERVEKLDFVSDSQKRDPLALLERADQSGADLMLTGTLRRNKVSYMGVSGVGSFTLDFALWLAFWWPSEIWPGVASESYRNDVELLVQIRDVRSREVLWETTYRHDETEALTQPERGWIPWGVIWVRFGLLTDGMLSEAGPHVRPQTWLSVERDVVQDLWSPAGFKGVLDANTFEDRINEGVVPRRQALVVAVSRYGPQAAPVLEDLGAAAAAERGEDLAAYRARYEDPSLDFGTPRPFAERDGEAIRDFLATEAGFEQNLRSLLGRRATRTQVKAALRQIAKARRRDPVFVYLNMETVVAQDPSQPGDGLEKYLLPYDADLVTLEELRARPPGPARTQAILDHLDRTAISFAWIADTFNQANLEDHRYLQSREVMLVVDAAFPGTLTGWRYAPGVASNGEAVISPEFLEEIYRVPGRLLVVGARFKEPLLDVLPRKHGAFAYHFLRGARQTERVALERVSAGGAAGEAEYAVLAAGPLLDYVRARVEDESRTLNRPQSILALGDNLDFPVRESYESAMR